MNRFKLTSIYTLLVGVFVITSGVWPLSGTAAEGSDRTGDPTRGARQWANNCQRCHNMRDPKEFRDDLWRPIVSHMRVRAGLTGQQARDILAFLQASNYGPPLAAEPADAGTEASDVDGKAVFGQTCVACHGVDGKGAIPGAPDFTASTGPLSKPDGILLRHMIDGFKSPGSPMAMPPRGGNPSLSDDDLRAALAYIRANFGK
jgi:cytochrome c5